MRLWIQETYHFACIFVPRSLEEVQRLVSTGSFELHLITHLLLQWTQLSVHIDVQIAVGDQNVIHL